MLNKYKQLYSMRTFAPYIIGASFLTWFLLLSLRIVLPKHVQLVSTLNQSFETVVHFILVILTVIIYRRMNESDKKIFKWFIITNIFFWINDLVFFIALYLPSSLEKMVTTPYSGIKVFINNFPFSVWLGALIIFLSKILIRDIISIKLFLKILLSFIVFNVIIICLFLIPIDFKLNILSWQHNLFLITSFIVELIIFDLAILCLIYSRSRAISFILSGFVILITGDFLLTFGRLDRIWLFFSYGGLFWCLGMVFMLWGLMNVTTGHSCVIKEWFRSHGSIKSRVTFWSFLISSGSFLLFFLVANLFAIINKNAFIALPLFIMLYSIVVVSLSVYIGKVFEIPFKKIEYNINTILLKSKDKIDTDFSIDEFIFLQKFIFDAFKLIEEQDLMRKKFGDMAAEVAHDIGSPLNAMDIAVSNLKKINIAGDEVQLLEKAMQSVKDISNNLLTRYRTIDVIEPDKEISNYDNGSIPRYIILSSIIEQLVSNKQVEWSNNPCKISVVIDKLTNVWVYVSPQQFSRVLSNLLNNSHESLDKFEREIKICIFEKGNSLQILLEDNGCGMLPENILYALSGKSFKHPGVGLGLSGAKKYFEGIGGNLNITSTYNEGTTILLTIPLVNSPVWFTNQILYSQCSIFVILDDDPLILMQWQRILKKYNLQCKYFCNSSEFTIWHNENFTSNIILLIDYDFKDKLNGFDIIQKFQISNSYMFTSHAEEVWLQNLANLNNFKLIPKSLIKTIQIIQHPL